MPPSSAIDDLLGHAEWLRELAAHVVRGAEREDAIQDTWLAALRSPPSAGVPPRRWLAAVLRNFARRSAVRGKARRRREVAAAGLLPEAARSPEVLLDRAEAQRRLASLVVALDEPYRSTVILRYYERLTAAAIGRALSLPAGTVRWRVSEGLRRLRERLDEPEDRRRLLVLALPVPRRAWQGGLIVAAKKKVTALVGLLLLALLAGGLMVWRGAARTGSPAPAARAAVRPPRFVAAPVRIPSGQVVETTGGLGIEGRVVSAVDGGAVAGAALTFGYGDSSLSAVTGPDGAFALTPRDPGEYLLARVAAPGYIAFSSEWGDSPVAFTLRPGERIRGVVLPLKPARWCPGTVVDARGAPAPRAWLHFWMPANVSAAAPADRVADDRGRFELPAIEGLLVEARLGEAASGAHLIELRDVLSCAFTVRLRPAGHVDAVIGGRVENGSGQPVAGAMVQARAVPDFRNDPTLWFARAETGADGRFQLGPLEATAYDVDVVVQGHPAVARENVPAGTHDLVLRLPSAGRLTGRVRDATTGAPVTSFSILLFAGRERSAHTRYDTRGDFAIEEVPAGSYSAVAVAAGYSPSDPLAVEVRPADAATVVFQLGPGTRVHGQLIDGRSREPIAAGQVTLEGRRASAGLMVPFSGAATTDGDGRFSISGAPAGRVSLVATAPAHHGRVVGGVQLREGTDEGPVVVELVPLAPGEVARVEMVGIGAVLGEIDEGLAFLKVMPASPAAEAGLTAGDRILAIDGTLLRGMPIEDAIQWIRGPEGSVVSLHVRRAATGGLEDIAITRRKVSGPGQPPPP